MRLSLASIGACFLAGACAHRIPARPEVENQPPIRWPRPPLSPLPAEVAVGPLRLELAARMGVVVIRLDDGPEVRYLGAPGATAGTSLSRGYAMRFAWIGPDEERDLEVFRGSPIASLFPRMRHRLRDHAFEIPDRLTEMIAFERDAPSIGGLRELALDPSRTTKPFVVFRAPDDSEGVVFFFPHRPEIRRWYLEDYTVTATLTAQVVAAPGRVEVRFPERALEDASTFDFPIYVMPYRGSAASAFEQFRIAESPLDRDAPVLPGGDGYWAMDKAQIPLSYRQSGLRMLRYFPGELASWIDASKYTYGHPGGFAWGDMTASMKGIRTDPLEPRALLRDQAFRMLTFFVEAGRAKGAPPNLMMQPQWTKQMRDPGEIRTIVFCQYWEFRLEEYARLFDSPFLTDAEKAAIYGELQNARKVFDPERPGFAKRTPNGGVWFDYLDVPIAETLPWIINTHATNLGNVGELALLARKLGRAADFDWWRRLFVAGLDGLDYAVSQDWMWTPEDPNELRYARAFGGPRSYHFFMLLVWVPHLARLSVELAPERTRGLLALMDRLMVARFIAEDEGTMATARVRRAEVEAARSSR